MNKILVEVYLPVADISYDVFIPTKSKLFEVLPLLSKSISELSGGLYLATEDTILCNYNDGAIYNINLSVEELGLKNGSKLILI
ncbi:MAG: hypothetical protein K0R15_1312 [Clostridiales bacterium]|jgi:hypothetical protein|nr:hypothetical protein [Clostridiales bacterium]